VKRVNKNVNYHSEVNLYSSSLGAIHLAFHETKAEAIDSVRKATELYNNNKPYKHLICRRFEAPKRPDDYINKNPLIKP
jgi:hypothetical protein